MAHLDNLLYPDNPHRRRLQTDRALEAIQPEAVLQAVARILARGRAALTP